MTFGWYFYILRVWHTLRLWGQKQVTWATPLCETEWGPVVVTPEQVSLPDTGTVADLAEREKKQKKRSRNSSQKKC